MTMRPNTWRTMLPTLKPCLNPRREKVKRKLLVKERRKLLLRMKHLLKELKMQKVIFLEPYENLLKNKIYNF